MAQEIERKFLVKAGPWHPDPVQGEWYRQGYLSVDPARVVRVRVAGGEGFLTIKGLTRGIERLEFEYRVPVADANLMLDTLCRRPLIEKTRFRLEYGGRVWEVDEFAGENAGLILAEVELPSPVAELSLPPWVGAEVSDDQRYFNSNLAQVPFSTWGRGG